MLFLIELELLFVWTPKNGVMPLRYRTWKSNISMLALMLMQHDSTCLVFVSLFLASVLPSSKSYLPIYSPMHDVKIFYISEIMSHLQFCHRALVWRPLALR